MRRKSLRRHDQAAASPSGIVELTGGSDDLDPNWLDTVPLDDLLDGTCTGSPAHPVISEDQQPGTAAAGMISLAQQFQDLRADPPLRVARSATAPMPLREEVRATVRCHDAVLRADAFEGDTPILIGPGRARVEDGFIVLHTVGSELDFTLIIELHDEPAPALTPQWQVVYEGPWRTAGPDAFLTDANTNVHRIEMPFPVGLLGLRLAVTGLEEAARAGAQAWEDLDLDDPPFTGGSLSPETWLVQMWPVEDLQPG